jgi:hypothetical protein
MVCGIVVLSLWITGREPAIIFNMIVDIFVVNKNLPPIDIRLKAARMP